MQISARNPLQGSVKAIHRGAVNAEVVLELPGGLEIVAIVTNTAVDALGSKAGKKAYAVIKASSVLVAVD